MMATLGAWNLEVSGSIPKSANVFSEMIYSCIQEKNGSLTLSQRIPWFYVSAVQFFF